MLAGMINGPDGLAVLRDSQSDLFGASINIGCVVGAMIGGMVGRRWLGSRSASYIPSYTRASNACLSWAIEGKKPNG